jgi:hypothetical protein
MEHDLCHYSFFFAEPLMLEYVDAADEIGFKSSNSCVTRTESEMYIQEPGDVGYCLRAEVHAQVLVKKEDDDDTPKAAANFFNVHLV